MSENLLYYQLGKFVILFQNIERAIVDLIVLMAKADDEIIEILINELDYSSRIKTTDVLFARYVDIRSIKPEEKKDFHSIMTKCLKLGELRNNLLHSKYAHLVEDDTVIALIRENSKLRGKKGIREIEEEDLTSESFDPYFEKIILVLEQVEAFRLKIIDWEYPEIESPNLQTDKELNV